MNKPIHVLNGPNLNRLGTREPAIYGSATLADIETACREEAKPHRIVFRQSNAEGQLVEWIHEAVDAARGIVINPAGYSFTSIAILDALKMFDGPIVEVHLSNIYAREPFRHTSLLAAVCRGQITGLGWRGYLFALGAVLALARGSP